MIFYEDIFDSYKFETYVALIHALTHFYLLSHSKNSAVGQ